MIRCDFYGRPVLVQPKRLIRGHVPPGVISRHACSLQRGAEGGLEAAVLDPRVAVNEVIAHVFRLKRRVEVARTTGAWAVVSDKATDAILEGRSARTRMWLRSEAGLLHAPVTLRHGEAGIRAWSNGRDMHVRTRSFARRYVECLHRYESAYKQPPWHLERACKSLFGLEFERVQPSAEYDTACARFLREARVHDTDRCFGVFLQCVAHDDTMCYSDAPSGGIRAVVLCTVIGSSFGAGVAADSPRLVVAKERSISHEALRKLQVADAHGAA